MHKALQDPQEQLVLQVRKVLQVPKVMKVLKEPLVQQVHKV